MGGLIKTGLALIFVGLACISASAEVGSVEDFLQSRLVICTVSFDSGASALNDGARKTLDEVVNQLKTVDSLNSVVRVEGFASPEGAEISNLSLSMERAKSVEDYLRESHDLPMTRYLIGRGVISDSKMPNNEQRRVEIAVYDNVLNIETSDVDRIVIDGKRD